MKKIPFKFSNVIFKSKPQKILNFQPATFFNPSIFFTLIAHIVSSVVMIEEVISRKILSLFSGFFLLKNKENKSTHIESKNHPPTFLSFRDTK
jgi:hypothetical protein